MSESTGERIRRLRSERGLSQRALASPGISAGYISRIEHGQRTPSTKAVRLLAPKLGVSPEYLETGSAVDVAARRELRLSEALLELRLADDSSRAEARLRELLEEAVRASDVNATFRARCGLGLAASQRGAHRETIEFLEPVVRDGCASAATRPDVVATLARAYVIAGPVAKAIALFERSLEELRANHPEESAAYVRFATYLSYALSDAGDLPGARAALDDALAHIEAANDPYSRVRVYWSQARLAEIEGQHANAQWHLRRAIALLDLTEDTLHLGRAHLLFAESTLAEGDFDQTAARLDVAERLLDGRAETKDTVWLLVLKAQLGARTGEADDAAVLAAEAAALAGDDDPELRGRAETALGEALWARGEADAAVELFEHAELLLAASERRYLRELLELWAKSLEDAGRVPQALAVYKRAVALVSEPRATGVRNS